MTRRTNTLRRGLTALVVLGLVPLSVLGVSGILSAAATQRTQLERSAAEISHALGSAVRSELDAQASAVAAVGRSPLLARGDLEGFYAFAKAESGARPDWSGMVLTDARGQVLFKTALPFGAADARVIDGDSLRETVERQQVTVGRLAKGQVHSFAYPVRVPVVVGGQLRYVLTAAVTPDRMHQLVLRQGLPDDWVISVFDRDLRRVARSRGHEVVQGGPPSPTLHRLLAEAPSRLRGSGVTETLEGEEIFTGFSVVEPHRWTVVVGVPTSMAHAPLLRSLAWYVLGIVASAMVCAALAGRISRNIRHAVHAVRDGAVRLGQGEPVHLPGSDFAEIDDLGRAITMASERLAAAHRETQAALAAAHDADRAKDRFLAVLGHELRNPLAPMLTALHLMERKGSPSTQRERQILHRQVQHLKRLVDDLLDVTRIATGKLEIDRRPVNLCDVVERAIEALPPSRDRSAVHVRLPPEPAWVEGDAVRLVQVLTNLLHNALRYGAGSPIHVTLRSDGARAVLAVRDGGLGMAADVLPQVFEPFYQAPQTLERATGGLGLGLPLVKEIVERHGGEVRAESAGPGQGSVFEVGLPTVEAPALEHGAPVPEAGGASVRVLVVDDNIDALDTLSQALRLAGHEVRAALTPEDALREASAFSPQVGILDIGLPGMSGYELAARLREATGEPLALIALTGYGQKSDRERATQAGFAAHLSKPAEPALLLREIERLRPAG